MVIVISVERTLIKTETEDRTGNANQARALSKMGCEEQRKDNYLPIKPQRAFLQRQIFYPRRQRWQEIFKILAGKDTVPLAWGENGFRELSNSKKSIRRPKDLKGVKIHRHWAAPETVGNALISQGSEQYYRLALQHHE